MATANDGKISTAEPTSLKNVQTTKTVDWKCMTILCQLKMWYWKNSLSFPLQ